MRRNISSIRTLIPLAASVLFVLVSVTSSVNQYFLFKRQILTEAPLAVRSTLISTQRHLEEAIARHDKASVDSDVVNLGVLSEVQQSTLINRNGQVVSSTVFSSKYKSAKDVIEGFDAHAFERVTATHQPMVISRSDRLLHVYFPVLAPQPHVLFVSWSLKPQIERLFTSLVYNILIFWLLGAITLGGLIWLLHRIITVPLKRLEEKVSRLNAADSEQPFEHETGVQEIRSLAQAMQVMHQRLQQSYADLQTSEQSYRRLFNMAQEGVWIINADGYTTMVNHSMATMLEYTVDDMLGKHMNEFMDDSGKKIADQNMENRRQGIAEQHDFEWVTRTGKKIYTVMETAPLLDEAGAFIGAIAGVMDITQRREAEQIITRQAKYDALTQLPNRRYMTEILEREMARAKRHGHIGAALFIDLDHFKNINDSLGHPVGDALLVAIGERLQIHLREEDTLARLGGDEFVVLLPELHHDVGFSVASAKQIAQKLQSSIAEGFIIDRMQLNITCSIGIAIFPQDQETIHDIIRQADTAMYRSKQDGRNLVRFFTQELQQEAERNLQLQVLLPKAIEEQQFELYFQPQLDHQQRLIGAEALLRWRHPDLGFISPLHFIRAAEESGLIHPLGDWVIRQVCSVLTTWQAHGLPASFERVAINISPRQFVVDDFAKRVCRLVSEAHIDPRRIELEITEGMLMSNLDSTIAKMQEFREQGFYLSIDDFGTGYSSLSYLKILPISKLKIDQSFTRDLGFDRNDRSIVETIILMAKTLELDVLAEGVETREQFDFLDSHGCHKYQGYFFGKPVPATEFFEKWIAGQEIKA